jgi:cob(I)alamin adenosyltransferase
MIVAGLMSDAQELMALGDTETARQYLNRAKSILFEMMDCDNRDTNMSFFPERK